MSVRHYDDAPAYLRGVCDGCGTMGPRVETSFVFRPGRLSPVHSEKFAAECKLAREAAGLIEAWAPMKRRRRVEVSVRDLCPGCAEKPLQPDDYLPCERCGWPKDGGMCTSHHAAWDKHVAQVQADVAARGTGG